MNTQWMVPKGAERYQCPTTGEWFRPLSTNERSVCGETFVWVYCPICDTHCHTRGHPEYDPLSPQPHCFSVVNEEVQS